MIDALSSRIVDGLQARRNADLRVAELRAMQTFSENLSSEEHDGARDGPAVIKTIPSEEAARAAWLEAHGRGHLANMSSEERSARSEAYRDDVRRQLHLKSELRMIERGRATLAENERIYAKMSSSEPVPPKELKGKDLDAARKLMSELGIPRGTFGHDKSVFVHEGTRYILHRDGKLESHDAEIAPSQEEKTRWLQAYAREIAYGKADPTSMKAEYDALTARVEAEEVELFGPHRGSPPKTDTTEQSPRKYSSHIIFG